MSTLYRCTLTASLTLLASAPHAQTQTLITQRGLTVNAALDRATTALERCRADGFKVTVTVLNQHARSAVVLSDDGVNPHTLENSQRKAYTAFTTRTPSGEMAKRQQPGLSGFMLLDKITPIEGGLPILADKDLVGSVGVSGAPGGEKDAACAQAGIEKIAKGLTPSTYRAALVEKRKRRVATRSPGRNGVLISLKSAVRAVDTVFRLGGDQFVVILRA